MADKQQNILYYTEGIGVITKKYDKIIDDVYLLFNCHFNSKENIDNGYFIPVNNFVSDVIVFSIPYNLEKYKLYIQKNVVSGTSRFIILCKQPTSNIEQEKKDMERMIPGPTDGRVLHRYIEMNIDGVNIKPFPVSALRNVTFIWADIIKSIKEGLKIKIKEKLNETLTPSKKNEPIYNMLYKYGDENKLKNLQSIYKINNEPLQQHIAVSIYGLNDKEFLDNTINEISSVNIINKLDHDKCIDTPPQMGGEYYKIKYIKDKEMYLNSKS